MDVCPRCGCGLVKGGSRFGVYWGCPTCRGRAVTLGVLRKAAPAHYTQALWRRARLEGGSRGQSCPRCRRKMAEVGVSAAGKTITLDVCKGCQFVWFDPDEFETILLKTTDPEGDRAAAATAQREIALGKLKELKRQETRGKVGIGYPESGWEWMLWVIGMPIEYNEERLIQKPLATWCLAAIIAIVSLAAFTHHETAVMAWGLIPAEAWRYFGLTLISSFFLHGGLIHLFGNLYFFVIFGDNVEDVIGKVRFVALLLFATVAGNLLHLAFEPHSEAPLIGASGGISGIMAYYALRFPHARIGVRLIWFLLLRLPVLIMFGLWILLQFLGIYLQLKGFSHVAATAHLGGAAAGALWWLVTRKIDVR